MTFGYAPTRKGALQMTRASRLSSKVHLALQYVIRHFFRIENAEFWLGWPRVSTSYLRWLTLTVEHWPTMATM
eukprot:4130611-Pyramimonas_sp.AAC.1